MTFAMPVFNFDRLDKVILLGVVDRFRPVKLVNIGMMEADQS